MRTRLLIAGALALTAVLVVLFTGPGRQATGELGLTADPSFSAVLGGALYEARTIRDEDGAPDIGYLTADAPLIAQIAATDAGGIGRVQITVDGRARHTQTLPCSGGSCPLRARVRFVPRLTGLGLGAHRVALLAGGPRPASLSAVAAFTVNVGAHPAAAVEIEPQGASTLAAPPPLAGPPVRLSRALATASRHGRLARLLGSSRVQIREHGTGAGVVTVLGDVSPPRRGVTATLPQGPGDGDAVMRAKALRDLLIDIDLRTGRILALQPGPASELTAWSAPRAAAKDDEAPSTTFTPRRVPRLLQLSDRGPAFFTQDGDPVVRPSGRDWPVSFFFTGRATVAKVKAALRQIGLTRRGHARYLGYQTTAGQLRFDADRGLKTRCDPTATDVHARVYAPSRTDHFTDPDLGDVVVATVHLDHVDGCGVGPSLFGFSERAERRVAAGLARQLRWRVQVGAYPVGNAEPLRRDAADPSHLWLADGFATGVVVP